MTTWAIGDIQGCFKTFTALIKRIGFTAGRDRLWLAGDLINRGPQSLEVLRWCFQHQNDIDVVLGNHDLHYLAVAYGATPFKEGKDTFDDILAAPDANSLTDWLRQQPLIHVDQGHILAHAGIYPRWTLSQAMDAAAEVEEMLQSDRITTYFQHMYGNHPDRWEDDLSGYSRLRFIVNTFTRMRICDANGALELRYKKGWKHLPSGFQPWFNDAQRISLPYPVLFGHWAALEGRSHCQHAIALDTGCVWGAKLTAYRLHDGHITAIGSEEESAAEGGD